MAARSCGNGTNFDWLRKSFDISTCDLSPDGNREKYGRPMKSAITDKFIIEANKVDPEQTAPHRSSLILAHTVCHRGFLNISADEKSRRLIIFDFRFIGCFDVTSTIDRKETRHIS